MKKVLSLCVMCLLTLSAMAQKTVWVDLDLPSGTKWKSTNENGFYTYDDAIDNFGKYVPTKEQWQELRACCVWEWTWEKHGYWVTGNNGNSIFLPAEGHRYSNGDVYSAGLYGFYWSSTPIDSDLAWELEFNMSVVEMGHTFHRCEGLSVRLVQ